MQKGSEGSFVPRMQDIWKICQRENNCFMRKLAVCMCDNKRHRSAVLPSCRLISVFVFHCCLDSISYF